MTITDDFRGLWRKLVSAARTAGKTKQVFDIDTPLGKHRADTGRRPYAPVGRTGARINRPGSHRAH